MSLLEKLLIGLVDLVALVAELILERYVFGKGQLEVALLTRQGIYHCLLRLFDELHLHDLLLSLFDSEVLLFNRCECFRQFGFQVGDLTLLLLAFDQERLDPVVLEFDLCFTFNFDAAE